MDCESQVYAEDYYDLIVDNANVVLGKETLCQQKLGDKYTVYYVNREEVPPLSVGTYKYSTIPKCYTILDQSALEESGVIRVQNQRNLELKGQGILIGFVDTGACVILLFKNDRKMYV